jgi:hypothetical protein
MSRTTKRLYLGYLCALVLFMVWASPERLSACSFMDCGTEKEDCGQCFTWIEWGEPRGMLDREGELRNLCP